MACAALLEQLGNSWVLAELCAVLQAWLAYADISLTIAVILGVSFELGSVTPFALAANLVLVLWILVPAVLGVLRYNYVLKGKWEAQLFLGTSTLAWVWSLFVCIYVGFCCICCLWALATSPCGFFVLAFAFALVR